MPGASPAQDWSSFAQALGGAIGGALTNQTEVTVNLIKGLLKPGESAKSVMRFSTTTEIKKATKKDLDRLKRWFTEFDRACRNVCAGKEMLKSEKMLNIYEVLL